MAYSELIKNFNRIRDYMREFYVYGFKNRDEYTRKSARSYDNERRMVESWLGDYMRFTQNAEGKSVFLSIDSRSVRRNPLYAAWKAKSFTDGDMTLHFILFDILSSPEITMSLNEITEAVDGYLLSFNEPRLFDSSTVRKKLAEYVTEGVIIAEKRGRTMYYRRADVLGECSADILDFFSETAPCGVIGSFLLDKGARHEGNFAFKHHYITSALDSEILCSLLTAISERRSVTVETISRRKDMISESWAVPLKIMISAQSGRQYLMAYTPRFDRITPYRIDNIISVKPGEVSDSFDELREKLAGMMPHIWGVSTEGTSGQKLEHVEFTVKYADDEQYIRKRLEREKRCGTLEQIDANTCRFSADVYDSGELVPWMRTFICRLVDWKFSNRQLEEQFADDLREMYALYSLEGGEDR